MEFAENRPKATNNSFPQLWGQEFLFYEGGVAKNAETT